MPANRFANINAPWRQKPNYHFFSVNFCLKKTVTMLIGDLVQATPYTFPATAGDGTYVPAFVSLSTTTQNGLIIGPCIGGSAIGQAPIKTVGKPYSLVQICTGGYSQVRVGTSVVAGHFIVQSTATAGLAKTATTPVLGKTVGTCLQTFTHVSGTNLVAALIKPV